MRAIDADALQLAIVEEGQANKRKKYIIGDIWELTGAEIREVINSQPTIQPEIVRCGECKWFQCNMRPDGYLPQGVDEFECRHWCGSCDPTDFCSYGEKERGGQDG